MPKGDGTGPQGKGPKTGRGLGPCPDDQNVRKPARGGGRGSGRGGGGGGGRGGGGGGRNR